MQWNSSHILQTASTGKFNLDVTVFLVRPVKFGKNLHCAPALQVSLAHVDGEAAKIQSDYRFLFENKTNPIMAYILKTVLAEKYGGHYP